MCCTRVQNALGDYTFLVFTVVLVFFWTYTYRSVPETRGRSVEEITAEFRQNAYGSKDNLLLFLENNGETHHCDLQKSREPILNSQPGSPSSRKRQIVYSDEHVAKSDKKEAPSIDRLCKPADLGR
ncbi:SLC2A1 [Cordylochernes scorpioides]|uniref:SLC2A1 n=1 Tax=Cordylochernes scorpioides TaxID=51811 RepID=A0ABY6KIS8_9ARAC|nr:SLC2A1 [Cordylochernes scorpioides]